MSRCLPLGRGIGESRLYRRGETEGFQESSSFDEGCTFRTRKRYLSREGVANVSNRKRVEVDGDRNPWVVRSHDEGVLERRGRVGVDKPGL